MKAGVPVRIRVVARDGVAEYWREGERIFSYRDPTPLASGWFAFRTVRSHFAIEAFKVERLAR
jgi:rhamnogalacturonan endolyase